MSVLEVLEPQLGRDPLAVGLRLSLLIEPTVSAVWPGRGLASGLSSAASVCLGSVAGVLG